MKNKMAFPLSVLALGVVCIAVGAGAREGWPMGVIVFGVETGVLGIAFTIITFLGGGR